MGTESPSIERAVRRECETGAAFGCATEPSQLDLLRDDRGKLPSNVFLRVREGEGRGPGRPKGALNKRSEQLAKLVCQQSGDPVLYMASIYATPLDQLVELLKIADPSDKASKRGELAIKALNVQLAAASAVSPYVHSKKPVESNVNVRSDGVLIMPTAAGPSVAGVDDTGAQMQALGSRLALALQDGTLELSDLAGKRLVDGQIVDGDWSEGDADAGFQSGDDDEDDEDGGDDD